VLSVEEIRVIIDDLIKQSPDIPVRKLVQKLLAAANGRLGEPLPVAPPDDVTVLGLELETDAGRNELVFHPAGLLELDQIILQIHQRLLSEWRIEPDSSQRIRLFLDEALTNAWRHGSRQNPRLPIKMSWGQHNGFSIVVDDAGSGFDPTRLPDPRVSSSLLHETGRGVYLIRNSCEWAEWKKGGTRLVARLACPAYEII